MKFATKAIGL